MKNMSWIGWTAIVLVVAAVVAGFVSVGSPSRQRALKFDQQRVTDLSNIQYEIRNYWNSTGKLPAQLQDLNSDITGYHVPTDPSNQQAYEYTITGDLSFNLCANFELESTSDETLPYYYDSTTGSESWKHGMGKVCFDRKLDPVRDKYPVPVK